jgi:hypothetical protein
MLVAGRDKALLKENVSKTIQIPSRGLSLLLCESNWQLGEIHDTTSLT